MRALGASTGAIGTWKRNGDITRELPGVYAWGGAECSALGDLWAAVLYAGPGACVTGVNGAWWRGLLSFPERPIEVSTPKDTRSTAHVVVRARRAPERDIVRGLPVAPLPQLMLDLAATGRARLVRRALACLDYGGILDPSSLLDACGPGQRGSPLLRWSIVHHDPRLALTNGVLEDDFISVVCEGQGVPKPDRVDAWIAGIECDAVYAEQRVIVQLDGRGAHHSPAQKLVDHRNDMILRARGWTVLRYSWELVHDEPAAVAADLRRALDHTL